VLSHLNADGQPAIVDVSEKVPTRRTAKASAIVQLPAAVSALFRDGELQSKKGPVFQTAILAGIMAAKKTSELIPLCHPIGLEDCRVDIRMNEAGDVEIETLSTVTHKTGVEMEALTAASVAALTIYDMCKGISHDIVIKDVRLLEKRGGKSDYDQPR
jgi:cyclic pyranopterin phosphate synthase